MTLITIRETKNAPAGQPNAVVQFNHGDSGDFPITVQNPFSPEEEAELAWYYEEHLIYPFMDQTRAEAAAKSVQAYGERLFEQVLGGLTLRHYSLALGAIGPSGLSFEIIGSPEFHKIHWEALKDPQLPRPFALDSPMVRRNQTPRIVKAEVQPSPTLNVLLVVARPKGRKDVSYRTISRPLVESLRQAGLRVRLDILRPGDYASLSRHLEHTRDERGAGFYHIVHFDVHGALLKYDSFKSGVSAGQLNYAPGGERFGRGPLEPYEGYKAFLLLEGESGAENDPGDLVEAGELAKLLNSHQIPVVVLNACQSGKEAGGDESSLAGKLMEAGVQAAVGMSYSVTVTAAEILMTQLYQQLFAGRDLSTALRQGRLELANRKQRKAAFDQQIELEDWLLPVIYQNQPFQMTPREFTPTEQSEYYTKKDQAYAFPEPIYGFVGRDLDILEIEKRLLKGQQNKGQRLKGKLPSLLLVRGMGGAGKTTLLRHLGAWWQTTHLVEQVFYFGYDEKPQTAQQICAEVAQHLAPGYANNVNFYSTDAGQARVAELLRGQRHLLILDNLESITGADLAIGTRLPELEQTRLKRLLGLLAGGKTLVLLGSRSDETWLAGAGGPFPAASALSAATYTLGGLDPLAATDLAERILDSLPNGDVARRHPDFTHLLKLLDGYPLALEVVLPNLAHQTTSQVLEALQKGLDGIDAADGAGKKLGKTESILKCVEYSHSNLSEGAQALLDCLSPFNGFLNIDWVIEQYTETLRAQLELAHLPYERWAEVLQEATRWGLLSPHPEHENYLGIQPVLPYFLRARRPAGDPTRAAIERAFTELYREIGQALRGAMDAKEPQQRQVGLFLTRLEEENLRSALNLALARQESISKIYFALSGYQDAQQDQAGGLLLTESTLARLHQYSAGALSGELVYDLMILLDNLAKRRLLLKQYSGAEQAYKEMLAVLESSQELDARWKGQSIAIAFHQLGRVAEAQRQWVAAEHYFQQALAIWVEFNDRYSQASTYLQLGIVAEAQRQWEAAERYCKQSLAIQIEFNDRYNQAVTYHQLGKVAQEQRQWDAAEYYYQQALLIKIEFNDRYNQAGTYHELGIVAEEQRLWAAAEHFHQQALVICVEFNDRYGQASTYHELGMVAEAQRQWDSAEYYYQQALAIKAEFNDRYNQAVTYQGLGRLAREQQQWDVARDYFRQSLALYLEFKDEYWANNTLYKIALLWQSDNDPRTPGMVAELLGISAAEAEEILKRFLEPDNTTPDGG